MTEGSPARLIFTFAIPLMLGNMLQQVYTLVDTLIVGRALGVSALAALGSADWYNYLMISVVQGFTQGFSILMAQNFGAGRYERLKQTVAHSIFLCTVSALLLTAFAEGSISTALVLLRVPEEIQPLTTSYFRILFAGIPAMMLFNFGACTLRALGNGRTPLYAMVSSSLLNIGLDLLFVLVFQWGIEGAAIATVISQIFSGVFCLVVIRRIPHLHVRRSDFARDLSLDLHLLRLSFPMVLQNVLISIGGMIVSYVANGFGVVFIAGYTATNKLYGMLEMAAVAYGYSMVTYTGQNFGAGKSDRIRRGLRDGLLIAILTGAVVGLVMILFSRPIVGAFLSGDPAEVAAAEEVALRYLFIISVTLPILYVLHVVRSSLQGLGDTVMPMLSGIAEFAMRTLMALVAASFFGATAIMYGEVIAWIGADVVLIGAIVSRLRKLP